MTEAWKPSRELEQVLTRLLDGELSPSQRRQLGELLQGDEAARRYYIRLMSLHAKLHARLEDQADTDLPLSCPLPGEAPAALKPRVALGPVEVNSRTTLRRTLEFFAQPTPLSLSVAAIVVSAVLLLGALIAPPVYRQIARSINARSEPLPAVFVASLTRSHEAHWAVGQIGATHGSSLRDGQRMVLEAGLAEITFRSGAVVLLQGPASLIVHEGVRQDEGQSLGAGTLENGLLTAHVPPSAKGFRIETAVASIVDLGTQFGVAADGNRSTEVHVFVGRVETRLLEDSANVPPRVLQAGQSLRFENGKASRGVRMNSGDLALTIPEPETSDDPYIAAVKAARPMALWRLNERGAGVARSHAGRPHGQYRGDVKQGGSPRPGDAEGVSAVFDGQSSFVSVPYSSTLNGEQFTVEAWVRAAKMPADWASVVTSRGDVPHTTGYIVYLSPRGHWEFWTGNGRMWDELKGPAAKIGQWTHLAVTFQQKMSTSEGLLGGEKRLYVNGQLVARNEQGLYMPHVFKSYPLRIGAGTTESDVPQYLFSGQIADVAVYGRPLSAEEIAAHYQAAHAAETVAPQ